MGNGHDSHSRVSIRIAVGTELVNGRGGQLKPRFFMQLSKRGCRKVFVDMDEPTGQRIAPGFGVAASNNKDGREFLAGGLARLRRNRPIHEREHGDIYCHRKRWEFRGIVGIRCHRPTLCSYLTQSLIYENMQLSTAYRYPAEIGPGLSQAL